MIAIVDYRAGNLQSVRRAVQYLGHDSVITDSHKAIRSASHVIFPGVGAAGATMKNLAALGLDALLRHEIFPSGKPMLGICIGIQIIFQHSEEDNTNCLGIMPGTVRRFSASNGRKIPQIGWNNVHLTKPHPVFKGVTDGSYFYFVNSYYPIPAHESAVYATAQYGEQFACVVAEKNLLATQFHLEKSAQPGLKMLDNFCRWDGKC